jgi:steroid delta-isomerase-like uncharacterized protein
MEEFMKNVSTTEANIALVQGMYSAFFKRDLASIIATCTPDIDWESIGPRNGYPIFGPRHGTGEVEQFFHTLAEVHQFNEFSPQEFLAAGDIVVVLGHYAFTINHNGRKVASDWAHAFTIRDGKVVKFREHTDSGKIAEANRDSSAPAASEGRKAIIRRWVEDGWNRRNPALIDEIFAPDVVQHDPNGPPVASVEALKEYVGGLMTALPDLKFTIENLAADGDRVVWRFGSRGTHRGPLMGIPATGKTGTVTGQVEFRFAGDKVAEIWINYDQFGLLRQLGVIPA